MATPSTGPTVIAYAAGRIWCVRRAGWQRVSTGAVDILIGTHRLLSQDVSFADLGLVIVDEEQRFGVEHKTRLRQVRKTAAGTYLTSQQCNGGKAREYSADGKLLRTFPSGRFSALRLENGNTLLGCGDEHRLIEVDPDNAIVWELKQGDLPDVKMGFIAAVWQL